MTVRVLLFGVLAHHAGQRELRLELPADATVAQAVAEVARRHPAVATLRATLAPAVGLDYVKMTHPLADGDELALIPPVSGG